jgi:predicted metalloprotease with PDZ domain
MLAALLPLPSLAADTGFVDHRVDFPRRHNQYVTVTSVFPVQGNQAELVVPVWSPGSYLVRDFSAQIENLGVTGIDGQALPVRKVSKNRWLVDCEGESGITVNYEVWAGVLNVSSSWVESSTALLNGAGVFMFTDHSRSLPQQVKVVLPADWSTLHTSLDPTGDTAVFLARDYDELVDSPFMAGNAVAYDFEVDEQPYALVFSGESRFWDAERARDDVAKIVKSQQDFWGRVPFSKKYYFLNFFMGSSGGLEHDHSTVLMSDPLQMRNRDDYIKWLGLVSHEFFHSWNVRRLRPSTLSEYDYDGEMYTRELWLAEGLTSYYDNLLLLRAGLIEVAEYLKLLAAEIRNYETTPGREVRSAEQASFDTWIKQYKQDDNSVNSTVSYYRKGALIGFVTDTAIRRQTDNKVNLDTVMRTMFERYPSPRQGGYPPGAFESLVEELAGAGVRGEVEEMLRTTRDPAVDEALDWYGLVLVRSLQAEAKTPAGLGVIWDDGGAHLLVEQVVQGHAGSNAGLLPGDELLAVAGNRVTPLNYRSFLGRLKPGEEVDLVVARHGRLLTLETVVQDAIPEAYEIVPNPKIRNRQKNRMENWLGLELVFSKNR